jgi:hypothetical protein
MRPCGPVTKRKYTITHSDITAELFVFVAENYAEDQITSMQDEVRLAWMRYQDKLVLYGSVTVDDKDSEENTDIRNKIFYHEMHVALQALRQADRFLFDSIPDLDNAPVMLHFISSNPIYNKVYDYGVIGFYGNRLITEP